MYTLYVHMKPKNVNSKEIAGLKITTRGKNIRIGEGPYQIRSPINLFNSGVFSQRFSALESRGYWLRGLT